MFFIARFFAQRRRRAAGSLQQRHTANAKHSRQLPPRLSTEAAWLAIDENNVTTIRHSMRMPAMRTPRVRWALAMLAD
jgi:hypothetical protein